MKCCCFVVVVVVNELKFDNLHWNTRLFNDNECIVCLFDDFLHCEGMGKGFSKVAKPVGVTTALLTFAAVIRLSFTRRGQSLLRIESEEIRDTLSVLRCGTVGFLSYYLPFWFLKGGKDGPIRSAAAFGTFTGMYRLLRVLEGRYISDVGENVLLHRYGAGLCGMKM